MSSFDKNQKKWRARIKINGIKKHIGFFDTKEQADAAEANERHKNRDARGKPGNKGKGYGQTPDGKFQVRFTVFGKVYYHGSYDNEDEAIRRFQTTNRRTFIKKHVRLSENL
jgi:predicted RNA-binding protein with PUA domain